MIAIGCNGTFDSLGKAASLVALGCSLRRCQIIGLAMSEVNDLPTKISSPEFPSVAQIQ